MCCIATKFVPRLLTNDQKQQHIYVCLELQEKANEGPAFISRNIAGDGSWIYGYGLETKQQLSHSHQEQKVWQVWSSTKRVLIVGFLMGLSTMNLFLLTQQSTLASTVMF
jgi:hypothetical protein